MHTVTRGLDLSFRCHLSRLSSLAAPLLKTLNQSFLPVKQQLSRGSSKGQAVTVTATNRAQLEVLQYCLLTTLQPSPGCLLPWDELTNNAANLHVMSTSFKFVDYIIIVTTLQGFGLPSTVSYTYNLIMSLRYITSCPYHEHFPFQLSSWSRSPQGLVFWSSCWLSAPTACRMRRPIRP